MKKLLLFIFLIPFFHSQAQQSSLKGIVLNASDNTPQKDVVVMLISRKDSVLRAFQRSTSGGKYAFKNLKHGKYFIQCTYPGSADFIDTLNIDSAENETADTIRIINKLLAMKEILINKFTNGIRLNGDTVEYLADFFKTNPGATVEDMLKKIPGIQVNRNGEITAQGEKVKKILVDGEEFFPDDPTVATKYLRADMIDKVQVYDQREDTTVKSDDDKVKTMNLTLKADKKKGYFGKAEVASNFDKYTSGGAFSGYFNKKLKAAAYAKTSNYENANLGWEESQRFGGIASGGYNYDENYGYYSQGESFNDNLDSRGIPHNISAGATFSNTWDSSKMKLNSSYRFANEGINGQILTNSRYFLPDTSYSIHDTTVNRSSQDGHRANAVFEIKTDSFNTVKISGTFAANKGNSKSSLKSGTASERLINYSNRDLETNSEKEQINTKLEWNRKYRKKGKYFSTSISFGYNPTQSSQSQQSSNLFFAEAGIIKKTIAIDQLKKSTVNNTLGSFNVHYGDRINKFTTWNVSYDLNFQRNTNRISTFNRESGNLSPAIDSLSNNYEFNQLKNTVGIGLNYSRRKWSYWANTGLGISNYFKNDLTKTNTGDAKTQRQFINFIPRAGITYTWKKQSNIQLYYSGFTSAPSMNALQPIVNNSDPFNLSVGNAALIQSFNHSLNLYMHNYRTIKGRYFSAGLSGDVPRNAFVTSTTIDSNAVRRTMTVNANGNYSVDGNLRYSIRTKKLPLSISWDLDANHGKNISFTNNKKIETIKSSATASMDIGIYTDVVSLSLSYAINWNRSQNSLGQSKATVYIIQTPSYELELNLPGKFTIYHTGNFNIRPATRVFANNRNVYYLTGGIGKHFGKKRDFELGFFMNDILKQNVGFSRNISTNLVSEQLYTQLTRYWLVSFKWNFASGGGMKDEM